MACWGGGGSAAKGYPASRVTLASCKNNRSRPCPPLIFLIFSRLSVQNPVSRNSSMAERLPDHPLSQEIPLHITLLFPTLHLSLFPCAHFSNHTSIPYCCIETIAPLATPSITSGKTGNRLSWYNCFYSTGSLKIACLLRKFYLKCKYCISVNLPLEGVTVLNITMLEVLLTVLYHKYTIYIRIYLHILALVTQIQLLYTD